MKKLNFCLVSILALLSSCTSLILETNFKIWADSLAPEKVTEMYNSATPIMADARNIQSIYPFSYQDSITKAGVGNAQYPLTDSEGMTSIYYKKLLIFQNSWNYSYMDQKRSMTEIKYGTSPEIKLLKIKNESYFPGQLNGLYKRENKLFIEKDGRLEEITLDIGNQFTDIKMTARQNTVIFYSADFARPDLDIQYLTLLDLSTKESKKFKY